MEIYVKISFNSIFSLILVFKHDSIRCVDFTQLQAQKVMTSQIRSHIEYLIQGLSIFLCSFCSRNWWKIQH